MTKTVELDEAQATLGELFAELTPDDEVVIVKYQKPIARFSPPKLERSPLASAFNSARQNYAKLSHACF